VHLVQVEGNFMAFLDDETLQSMRRRIFVDRTSTLESEGRALPLSDLIETVQRVRHRMLVALDSLPKEAFEPQPVDANGNEVWSAGQLVSHICTSQLRFTENVGKLVEYKLEPETDDLEQDDTLPMTEARMALKTATVILRQTLKAIPEDADFTKTMEHERFGTIGVKGWLVLVAVHEHDHVQQFRSLGTG
jgi:uncharacterized damage-inducible protein DinB